MATGDAPSSEVWAGLGGTEGPGDKGLLRVTGGGTAWHCWAHPNGFASPAGVAPAAQPGLGSGADPEGFPQQGATFSPV